MYVLEKVLCLLAMDEDKLNLDKLKPKKESDFTNSKYVSDSN